MSAGMGCVMRYSSWACSSLAKLKNMIIANNAAARRVDFFMALGCLLMIEV